LHPKHGAREHIGDVPFDIDILFGRSVLDCHGDENTLLPRFGGSKVQDILLRGGLEL
jgi:hypothetical protein